jgi:diamine N-acetyltransferase
MASDVSLREITEDSLRDILRLSVTEAQKGFVADNAVSIAQAHFSKHAWMRAIYADDTPVGFLMLYDDHEKPEYFLWRLMVDARYQRSGFARRAVEQLIEHVRARPRAQRLMTSAVPGEGGPRGFYERLGFHATGEMDDDEEVLCLEFGAAGDEMEESL